MSDPSHKQSRSGALHEGREVYCSNVDWSATEDELRTIFSKYGTVERVNIPRNVAGKSKGFAFIVFEKQEEAVEAVEAMNLTKFKSRILNISMATANPVKRQATVIQPRSGTGSVSASASPAPDDHSGIRSSAGQDSTGGNRQETKQDTRPNREDIQSRTLALLNIPDTVNDARIRALMEPYGALTKLVLRPDHQGAIVEYTDTKDAGRAALGVEGYEIVPGRRIAVGSVRDLFGKKAELRDDKGSGQSSKGKTTGGGGKEKEKGKTLAIPQPGPIRRPGMGRGRRGGLGVKRGGLFGTTARGRGSSNL